MCFLQLYIIALLLIAAVFTETESSPNEGDLPINNNVFNFSYINQCKSNEYYNLDYFTCLPCDTKDTNLEQSFNKFSCQCKSTLQTTVLYDAANEGPICIEFCASSVNQSDSLPTESDREEKGAGFYDPKKCVKSSNYPDVTRIICNFKYINFTNGQILPTKSDNFKNMRITANNPTLEENCTVCNLKYNYHYKEFCIHMPLLKPYLNYDAFSTTTDGFNGDLKFVAFFCLSLRNATACNQLANLCVVSFYSFDKNSPCSPFLWSQASDSLLRYAHLDEHLKLIRPFMFYRKGKESRIMLSDPIRNANFSSLMNSSGQRSESNYLNFFATVYSIDGSMERWGPFRPSHVNMCRLHSRGESDLSSFDNPDAFRCGIENTETRCQLSLENIIDLSRIYSNDHFFNVFLNFTSEKNGNILQNVPILIENLKPENGEADVEEWQLVKRFQLFESHKRPNFGSRLPPSYEDEHKLMLYKEIRYVDKFEISCSIKEDNRISIPIIKLHYRTIEFSANSSLDEDVYTFRFLVRCTSDEGANGTSDLSDILFLVFLLMALIATFLRTYNFRRRYQKLVENVEFCDAPCITELLLSLMSNVANTLLAYFLVDITYRSVFYLTQRNTLIMLPMAKPNGALFDMAIYTALFLKLIYFCTHFWRLGHIDLFFVDWERPRTCDASHFSAKNNLETSSVCSSVRTLVPENNVSAWRIFYIANEWILLSGKQQTCVYIQCIFSTICFNELIRRNSDIRHDVTVQLFVLAASYAAVFLVQFFVRHLLLNPIGGHPLQKLVDICSLANISIMALSEYLFGFYIHGRSPHGFADTDVSTMLLQLQRESQNMCGKRGLLSDSDQQTYIILPPANLRMYCENLLIPLQKSCNISQAHLKRETLNDGANLEKMSMAYSSINRFFCAFIDHAICDMDYIIKEKTFVEKLLNVELDNYLTKNKGTFYIDNNYSFSRLFLYGNIMDIFVMELLLLLFIYNLTNSAAASVIVVCLLNKLFQKIFCFWVRQNLSSKTLIDKSFLK